MLASGWLPHDPANAVEANHAEFRGKPEIPVGRLSHCEDIAQGEPVPAGPRAMRILADVQRWVQRQSARRAQQECETANCNERQRSFHCGHTSQSDRATGAQGVNSVEYSALRSEEHT